jgi:murein L,D-transpeptidase YafK
LCYQKRIIDSKNRVVLIQVDKSDRILNLFNKSGDTLYTCKIKLGFNPKGHKQFKGDGKTPEGTYTISLKNPESIAYKSLRISYPNQEDIVYAESKGKSVGGSIMIHGTLNKWTPQEATRQHKRDWTGGCIAVTNEEMDEIYRLVKVGTKIIIKP